MTRLTIKIFELRHGAVKEAAAVRGKTIGQLIDESLDFYGIKSLDDAAELVRRARTANGLSQQQAMDLANDEVQLRAVCSESSFCRRYQCGGGWTAHQPRRFHSSENA